MDILRVQRLEVQRGFSWRAYEESPEAWKNLGAMRVTSAILYGCGRVCKLGTVVDIRAEQGEERRTRDVWTLFNKKILPQEGYTWE